MITAVLSSSPLAFFKLMNQTPMELFLHGGPIMWPILITAFVGITVSVERTIFLVRSAMSRQPQVLEAIYKKIQDGDFEGAKQIGLKSKDPVAKTISAALAVPSAGMMSAFTREANSQLRLYQQGSAVLDTVVTAAPYLGLLGTVTGMMETFGALGTGADISQSSAKITGGVAEALIATMCGLAIAILGLIPYNTLNASIEQVKHDMADASNTLTIYKVNKADKVHA
ncbi:biopolymer transport protein ExbB [Ereboglobus sp. PH5-5]|uniref:Flagellar motor protein MotA n=1 Tax=Ereboglobus luteus TaxID=1796921 RepID=A0A2U8E2X6_9BACT|nr:MULTISPECIES: MotA/TolQ/ExbB proton channel family protein [Ereboglobus]AWI08882.1 flagellar motor protein MotA [Ereboglobus luteus]MDF9827493.1 biopolymer transport protein ExbB [Ereboglobus sp. PH5-10]MDF9834135.1 biopolymer transport protein ExbB [Ereboglobus sp. PH5-5]